MNDRKKAFENNYKNAVKEVFNNQDFTIKAKDAKDGKCPDYKIKLDVVIADNRKNADGVTNVVSGTHGPYRQNNKEIFEDSVVEGSSEGYWNNLKKKVIILIKNLMMFPSMAVQRKEPQRTNLDIIH